MSTIITKDPIEIVDSKVEEEMSVMTSSSFVDFCFPEQIHPTLFPYYASAGSSIPPASDSVTTGTRETGSGSNGCYSNNKESTIIPSIAGSTGSIGDHNNMLPVLPETEQLVDLDLAQLEQHIKDCDNLHRLQMEKLQLEIDILKRQQQQQQQQQDHLLPVQQQLVLPQEWTKHNMMTTDTEEPPSFPEVDMPKTIVTESTTSKQREFQPHNLHNLQMEKLQLEIDILKKQQQQQQQKQDCVQVPQELVLSQEWTKHSNMTTDTEEPLNYPKLDMPKNIVTESTSSEQTEFQLQLSSLQRNPFPTQVISICRQWYKACEMSDAFCCKVVLYEGMEALLDAMVLQKDFPEVQEAVCRVLGALVYNHESFKEWLAETDGLAAILSAMQRFASNPDVQEAACGALHNFVFDHEPSQLLAAQSGVISSVLNAMQTHGSDAGVQELGCAALANMACHSNPEILESIVHCGGVDVVVRTMEQHQQDGGVQEAACAALSNLISHDTATAGCNEGGNAPEIQSLGISAVIDAMKHHEANMGVQEQACRAIQALAYHHDGNKILLAESGAIAAVYQAMKRHASDASLQLTAIDALTMMVGGHDFHKTLLIEADGISGILSALSNPAHASHTQLASSCLKALCILAAHSTSSQRLIGLSGGLPCVLSAIRTHDSRSEIQRRGLRLLERLTSLPENRSAFVNANGLETIGMAKSNFPTLRESYCGILRNLIPSCDPMERALAHVLGGCPSMRSILTQGNGKESSTKPDHYTYMSMHSTVLSSCGLQRAIPRDRQTKMVECEVDPIQVFDISGEASVTDTALTEDTCWAEDKSILSDSHFSFLPTSTSLVHV